MMTFRTLLPVLLLPAAALAAEDGTLLSSVPCEKNPVTNWPQALAALRSHLADETREAAEEGITWPGPTDARLQQALGDRRALERRLAYRGFECRRVTYASQGLVISGLLWKPKDTRGPKRPLLIALRGGNATYGAMEPWRYDGWFDFLEAGYVVLATQYRGGPGSEGTDEFGGKDLDDVRALVPLAASLGFVDTTQVFLSGGSRGGMEAYLLAREGMPLRAVAIRAGLADLERAVTRRPLLEQALLQKLVPGYQQHRQAVLEHRSAARWAGELTTPLILFHGSDDWRLDPQDTLDVAAALQRAHRRFELHLYDGDTHALTLNERDMLRRTLDFFERFRAPR